MEERSALAHLGITQWPAGTTEEVIDAGYDPTKVASCCDGKTGGHRACPVWSTCRFHQHGMGGFKGSGGPKYIGYRYIDPADGTVTQDVMKCHAWVMGMQGQADAGAAQRRMSGGTRGRVIKVIAQEGDEITTLYHLPINGKGQVINPMPEMIDILERNNVPFSRLPNEVAVAGPWPKFELKRLVPRHPRPGEAHGDSFAHRVAQWDLEDEQQANRDPYENVPATTMPTVTATAEPVKVVRNPYGRAGKPKE